MFKKSWHNPYFIGILLFLFCLLVQGFWLATYFPGAMSNDSINMWQQSIAGSGYNSLQPYLYNLYLHFLRQIWDSPALAAGVQVVISSLLASGFSVYLLRKEANKWLIAGGYLAFVFSIPIMVTNTLIHRNSLYAQLVLLLSIVFIMLFFRKEGEISTSKQILLGSLIALITSMRYDGAVYLIVVPLLLYIFKLMSRKGILIVTATAMLGFFIVQVPLAKYLNIQEDRFLQASNLESSFIGAVYQDHPESFTTADIELMTKVAPIALWKKYDPTDDSLYWDKYKKENFYSPGFRKEWEKLFYTKISSSPWSIVKNRYYMTVSLIKGEKINGPRIVDNDLGLEQSPLTGQVTKDRLGRIFHDARINQVAVFVIWTPLFLIVHGVFLVLAIIKKKYYLVTYILIGLASLFVIIPFITSGQFRYMYPLLYSSFFVPALYTLKSRKEEGAVS